MSKDRVTTDAPSEADSSFVLEPGVVVARKYRIERLLKRGGMGAVWVATHLGLDTTVAIKFMNARMLDLIARSDDDEDEQPVAGATDPKTLALARFEREAKAAARIRSTNVVQMLDHGVDHGTPYIVMELLRGEDLETRLKRVGRLSFAELSPIVNAVARALQLAHAEELVHRDLKPENIFLAKEGDEEIPKILDFGVAKAKSPSGEQDVKSSTSDGTMVGTPHYMSPEQVQAGAHVDHRADLWSLGVVIFRVLTGRLPFPSNGILELAMQICREPIPRATSIVSDLPPSLDEFFDKALSRDPQKRFQSARELATAFQDIATARPITTSTSSVSAASVVASPLPQNSRSRNGLFVLAGLVVASIVAGAALMIFRTAPAGNTQPIAPSSTPVAAASPELPRPPVTIAPATTNDAPVASSSSRPPVATTTAKTAVTKPVTTATTTSTSKTKKRNVGY